MFMSNLNSGYNRAADDLYAPAWISADQEPEQLFSEIVPGLSQGGTPDEDWDAISGGARRGAVSGAHDFPFDAVVSLFAWSQPCDWGVEELRYGFYDAHPKHADMTRVIRAARWAHERWTGGDRVLIRCQAGLNRSGLVTALVLMLDGWTARDAIRVIRERRAEVALVNDDFVDWLISDAAAALADGQSQSTTPSSTEPVAA
jgi:hypothetical protein